MWIARNKSGNLWGYNYKPSKTEDDERIGEWGTSEPIPKDGICFEIPKSMFPEVKWEDEEPRELVLKPIKKD